MDRKVEGLWDPTILARLESVRMSETERHVAVDAMRSARLLVDACRWVAHTVAQARALVLKPGAQS